MEEQDKLDVREQADQIQYFQQSQVLAVVLEQEQHLQVTVVLVALAAVAAAEV